MPNNIIEVLTFDDAGLDRLIADLLRDGPLVLREQQVAIPEDRASVRALCASVYRAVDALENQGSRSNRIALQLLEALAKYESAMADELAPLHAPDELNSAVAALAADLELDRDGDFATHNLLQMLETHGLRLELAK